MKTTKEPVTQAVRALRAANIPFAGFPYPYVEGGGTAQFARHHGVDEHLVIKTLIMQDDRDNPLIVLMHGDRQVSTQTLARALGVKRIIPCLPRIAEKHSGYLVGGTSPFGTRRQMPVYCERSIADLPRLFINGGKRGYIIALATTDAMRLLQPRLLAMAV